MSSQTAVLDAFANGSLPGSEPFRERPVNREAAPTRVGGLTPTDLLKQAFQGSARNNPSRLFPGLEAPSDPILAAQADHALALRLSTRAESAMLEALTEWQAAHGAERGAARRVALGAIKRCRDAETTQRVAWRFLLPLIGGTPLVREIGEPYQRTAPRDPASADNGYEARRSPRAA